MIVNIESQSTSNEIKSALEGNDDQLKAEMLKKSIAMGLAGEQIPGLLICVIRYVLPSEDHTMQRLLLLYLVRRSDLLACRWHGTSRPQFFNYRNCAGDHREG
jgi:vesicle coat complex subunit